jgi:dynein heavy chain
LGQEPDKIIKSAVEIYSKSCNTFLPTPAKSHYTFNLRDLSKVVQGMLMCDYKNIESKEYLVKLYMSETYRVFRDRLINDEDRQKFSELAHQYLTEYLNLDWNLEDYQNILFGDFMPGE